jgi:hypothetical protein
MLATPDDPDYIPPTQPTSPRMDLIEVTFLGPPVDDHELFPLLPAELRTLLEQVNGFIQFNGALHVRGACRDPEWHSLRRAWMTGKAFHRHYREVSETDVPFAQDFLGNQFLLRSGQVVKLHGATGAIEDLGVSLNDFFEAVQADPHELLGLYILQEFREGGGGLEPGELLNTDPPLESVTEGEGVMMTPVSADEQLHFLREHHRQIKVLPAAKSDAA